MSHVVMVENLFVKQKAPSDKKAQQRSSGSRGGRHEKESRTQIPNSIVLKTQKAK